MSARSADTVSQSLPAGWPAFVNTALLHVVGLARVAVLGVRAGFASGPRDAKVAARLAALECENAQLREELRIKDARTARLAPSKRPHFAAEDRLAILVLRSARGWTTAETARRFLVTAATVASWFARRDEGGDGALVRTPVPVNRFPEYVGEVVRTIRESFPMLGTKRIAQMLARMGLHLGDTTVRREVKGRSRGVPPGGAAEGAPATNTSSATDSSKSSADRPAAKRVTATYSHDVWHIDLTFVHVGLWVPWIPFTLPQRWPFGWWVGAVLDHHSRAIMSARVWKTVPSAASVVGMLDGAVRAAGRAPKHIVTDQGAQFQKEYLAWCRKLGVRPRFGAVHQHGSIAMIERFWRSMKDECFRRIRVSLGIGAMRADLAAYLGWYHTERPHQSLGGLTPAERLSSAKPARDKRRLEPRPLMPIANNGGGRTRPRRVKGSLQLCVVRQLGSAKLPVLELRQAA